jgi:hypothetical protein
MTDDLVTVGQYQFLAEAEAARMHLDAEGIPAFLSDAETVNMDWLLGNAIGYIKLAVPRGQADAAFPPGGRACPAGRGGGGPARGPGRQPLSGLRRQPLP